MMNSASFGNFSAVSLSSSSLKKFSNVIIKGYPGKYMYYNVGLCDIGLLYIMIFFCQNIVMLLNIEYS